MTEPVQGGTAHARVFPRSARLLKHADFDSTYQNGRRYFSPLMSVFYVDRRAERVGCGPRVGLTVGRVLGGAVQRNRIKRRMRAMIREHLHLLAPAVDVVMNPKRQVLQVEAGRLSEEVRKAFIAILNQLDSPNRGPANCGPAPGRSGVRRSGKPRSSRKAESK